MSKSSSKHYNRNLHSYLSSTNGPIDSQHQYDQYTMKSSPQQQPPSTPSSHRRSKKSKRSKSLDQSGSHHQQEHASHHNNPLLSTSNWSLASSADSAERASLSSQSSSVNLAAPPSDSLADHSAKAPQPQEVALQLRPDYDLLTRTPWVDAELALYQIETGRAIGNRSSLWLRALVQARFTELGRFIQRNAGLVLFVAMLMLVTFCVGLKSLVLDANHKPLSVEVGGRLEQELQYIKKYLSEEAGSTSEIIIQTPRKNSGNNNVLHPNAMLLHLEALKHALRSSVELFEV